MALKKVNGTKLKGWAKWLFGKYIDSVIAEQQEEISRQAYIDGFKEGWSNCSAGDGQHAPEASFKIWNKTTR